MKLIIEIDDKHRDLVSRTYQVLNDNELESKVAQKISDQILKDLITMTRFESEQEIKAIVDSKIQSIDVKPASEAIK